jgi:hypothetical protein
LFIGPYALPAPPWGSVWLDRESVLFGDSTPLRQWMRENGIAFEMQQNEPEDHFGTLLLLAAWLAENGRDSECDQLLAWHLLPWSTRFLSVFVDNAGHPFYTALGRLAADAGGLAIRAGYPCCGKDAVSLRDVRALAFATSGLFADGFPLTRTLFALNEPKCQIEVWRQNHVIIIHCWPTVFKPAC